VIGVVVVAIVAAVSLTACGSNAADTNATGTTVSATSVPVALRFTAPLVGGSEFDGASVVGKPIAFWFWAPT
jgi:hypothetical protein